MVERSNAKRPRILLTTHVIPYPPDRNGWSVTVFPILKYLSADYDIDLMCPVLNNNELDSDRLNALRPYCRNILTFKCRKNIFKSLCMVVLHPLPLAFSVYSCKQFKNDISPLIERYLGEYKVLLVQDIHLARFMSRFHAPTNPMKVLVVGDYLTLGFKRIAATTDSILSKIYHWVSYRKLARAEPQIYGDFDSVIYVSSEDKRIFTKHYPDMESKIVVIPNGIDMENYRKVPGRSAMSFNSIIFTGNMRYEPNRLAVNWFYKNVFGILKRQCKGIMWNIVGNDASKYVRIDDAQVLIHNSVPSIIPYLQDATVVISPLQSGAGLKNKVLEAMACEKVVVGSQLSFDGIPIRNEVDAIIASNADDYVLQIKKYIDNPAKSEQVGRNAAQLIRAKFDINRTIGEWRQLIEGTKGIVEK